MSDLTAALARETAKKSAMEMSEMAAKAMNVMVKRRKKSVFDSLDDQESDTSEELEDEPVIHKGEPEPDNVILYVIAFAFGVFLNKVF